MRMILSLQLLGLLVATFASPVPSAPRRALSIPLTRRASPAEAVAFESAEERFVRLQAGARAAYNKYGIEQRLQKRDGNTLLGDIQGDIQYFAQILVGTPPTAFNVIVDTGSSDMLLATSPCVDGCEPTTPIYHPSLSSTSSASSEPFSVRFGTGHADGTLVRDKVSFAGYTLDNQVFAACSNLSGLLQDDIGGLLGLGWQELASSGALPFVQGLWEKDLLEEPVFGFALARHTGNATAMERALPGGLLTVGGVDRNYFGGDLNWMPAMTKSFWQIPLQSVSIQGAVLELSTETATIDTGTSLIGAPREAVETIYAQIPGSEPYDDVFYSFPCSTDVRASFTFGNVTYPMNTRDFNNGAIEAGSERCVGAVFVLSDRHGQGRWIFGDAFLKNVYSAFRFDPPSVGFARISVADSVLQTLGPVPTSNATLLSAAGSLAAVQPNATLSSAGVRSTPRGRGRRRLEWGVALLLGLWLIAW